MVGWMQAPLVELVSEVEVVLHNPLPPAGNPGAGAPSEVDPIEATAAPGTNSSNGTALGPLGALTLAVEIVR